MHPGVPVACGALSGAKHGAYVIARGRISELGQLGCQPDRLTPYPLSQNKNGFGRGADFSVATPPLPVRAFVFRGWERGAGGEAVRPAKTRPQVETRPPPPAAQAPRQAKVL